MSKRRLPLDSPNWTPLTEVHRFVREQTDDCRLADRDLTNAMANGRVRSMRRRVDPPRRADEPERELLPPSFWADYKLESCGSDGLLVVGRKPPPLPPWRTTPLEPVSPFAAQLDHALRVLRGYVFYAWKPNCKKIWVADAASTEARPPAQEVSVERGRKKVYEHAALTAIAFALFEHRKQGEPEKTQAEVARELRAWCKEQKEKVPGNTTLNGIVSVAFHVSKKWKASLKR
jgi:hypothetical protein